MITVDDDGLAWTVTVDSATLDAVKLSAYIIVSDEFWKNDAHASYSVAAKRSRWRRIRYAIRNAWSNTRFRIGHWIAGYTCDTESW